jgi:hypothetical protein
VILEHGAPAEASMMLVSGGGQKATASLAADGSFEFRNIPPGSYTVHVYPLS